MTENAKIDDIDRAILRALEADGRLSVQALSERVGLSPTPVARRIKALERSGAIRGYSAVLDETKLGFGISVFVSVRLDRQVDDVLSAFETAIAGFPEVVDCWLMTGDRDYLMRVAVSDMADFERFLTSRLTKAPGVSSIESSFPLRRAKAARARSA